jgi:hypothetical protein
LSAPQTLSGAGQNATAAEVAVDPNGTAVIAWTRSDGTNQRIEALTRSAAGVLSGNQILSDAGQNAGDHQVAVDPNGVAVFVWSRLDGTSDCGGTGCDRIQARVRLATAILSPPQTLSGAGQNASEPQVAVDPNGNAVATWGRSDGTIEAAIRP